jgi:hypothetical protein
MKNFNYSGNMPTVTTGGNTQGSGAAQRRTAGLGKRNK